MWTKATYRIHIQTLFALIKQKAKEKWMNAVTFKKHHRIYDATIYRPTDDEWYGSLTVKQALKYAKIVGSKEFIID